MIISKHLLSLVLSQFLCNYQSLAFCNLRIINFHSAVHRIELGDLSNILFLCKNIVCLSKYSYFSAEFRLKIFQWILIDYRNTPGLRSTSDYICSIMTDDVEVIGARLHSIKPDTTHRASCRSVISIKRLYCFCCFLGLVLPFREEFSYGLG